MKRKETSRAQEIENALRMIVRLIETEKNQPSMERTIKAFVDAAKELLEAKPALPPVGKMCSVAFIARGKLRWVGLATFDGDAWWSMDGSPIHVTDFSPMNWEVA